MTRGELAMSELGRYVDSVLYADYQRNQTPDVAHVLVKAGTSGLIVGRGEGSSAP